MTKSDLEQLTLLNSEISRDLERLQELYALLTGCTSSISGLPHIGLLRGSDRTDKFVSMIDVLEQQIKERVLDSAALYIQIWSYINTIHDPLVPIMRVFYSIATLQLTQGSKEVSLNVQHRLYHRLQLHTAR